LQFGVHLFSHDVFAHDRLWKGKKTLVLNKPESALFRVSGLHITPMGFGHFTGFFKIVRIGKPGQKWGFRD
jgi:hypothetical protein